MFLDENILISLQSITFDKNNLVNGYRKTIVYKITSCPTTNI